MGEVLLDDIIHTDYGQLDVVWGDGFGFDGDFDRFFDGQVNGLVGAADPNGFYVNLARRSGGSAIVIELFHSEPTMLDEEWADVVEVSISVPGIGPPRWSSWAGESGGSLDIPAGHYRVRVSARGRDAS